MTTPNRNFWKNKNVLVTGGTGFLGTYFVKKLKETDAKIFYPDSRQYDLRKNRNCHKVVHGMDIVIHLAAKVGGIGYNLKYPGEMFFDNIMMGAQLMEEARLAGVSKFIAIGTVCAYPKFTPIPFKEKDLWNGYPEETNAPYGIAKKMLLVQSQAYRQQYGFNSIFLIPVNMYGPGDNFDSESSHVIPALIRKTVEAKRNNKKEIIVWGTGKSTREFLFVEDCVNAIILACEKYNKPDPVNIGSHSEISIKDLVNLICSIVGYQGKIVWDKSKPDGQPRRKLDTSQALKEFGFKAKMPFREGLRRTINCYMSQEKKYDNSGNT